jgi:hypothetical protein
MATEALRIGHGAHRGHQGFAIVVSAVGGGSVRIGSVIFVISVADRSVSAVASHCTHAQTH